jgi:hypothetical protein
MSYQQIPNLPAAISLSGSELIEVVQAGVSVRSSTGALASLQPGPIGPQGPQGVPGPAGPGGAQGYWGSFYDTTNQAIVSTTTAYAINLGNSDPLNNGVSIVGGNKITVSNSGVYNLQYSLQLKNSDTQIHNAQIWLRKNDTGSTGDVANSNSYAAITASHGGTPGYNIVAVNYVMALNSGDYLQLMWNADNTSVSISTLAAGTNPTSPVSPGVILTMSHIATLTASPVTPTSVTLYQFMTAIPLMTPAGDPNLLYQALVPNMSNAATVQFYTSDYVATNSALYNLCQTTYGYTTGQMTTLMALAYNQPYWG